MSARHGCKIQTKRNPRNQKAWDGRTGDSNIKRWRDFYNKWKNRGE